MKKTSTISVTNNVDIPVKAIEDYVNTNINKSLAGRRTSQQFRDSFSTSYETIDCCSAYVPVTGTIEILFKDEKTGMNNKQTVQVESSYFFTCAKGNEDLYKVAWSCSLS